MENRLISVVVPVYNIENYIARCLDSLLQQTYSPIEIIAVDDGSSDKSGFILDSYSEKYENIRVIHKKNEGVSKARNTGIDIANGDFIGFVDGDDIVESDFFEVLYTNAIKYQVDISHCGYQMVFPNRVDYYYNTMEQKLYNREDGLYALLKGYPIEPGLWNKLYRKELFDDIRLPDDIRINEDLLVNYWLFKKAKASFFDDRALYHYMIRKNSASTGKVMSYKLWDPVKVCSIILAEVDTRDKSYVNVYARYINSLMHIISKKQVLGTDKRRAKQYLAKELKCGNCKKNLSFKLLSMVRLAVYGEKLYILIRFLYNKITKVDQKYKI